MIACLACPGKAIIELTQTRKEPIGVVGSELYTQKSITLLYRKSNHLQNNEGENTIHNRSRTDNMFRNQFTNLSGLNAPIKRKIFSE